MSTIFPTYVLKTALKNIIVESKTYLVSAVTHPKALVVNKKRIFVLYVSY